MVGISHPISWFIIYNFNIMVRCKVFFFWQNFIKFWPEKYDFDLCLWFLMKEMTQICQILNPKKSFFFILSYLACNQMWLNHFMDDGQLSYITKLKKKKNKPLQLAIHFKNWHYDPKLFTQFHQNWFVQNGYFGDRHYDNSKVFLDYNLS
jgi:hypothetical protein